MAAILTNYEPLQPSDCNDAIQIFTERCKIALKDIPKVVWQFQSTTGVNTCLKIYLTKVVWICQTFENNFGKKHTFTKYLKESYR